MQLRAVARFENLALAALMLAAAALFASGVMYGLPQQFDPDETIFVTEAAHMAATGSLDPGWYGAPASLLMYLLAGLYAVIGLFSGFYAVPGGLEGALTADVTLFHATGRVLIVIATLICLPLIQRLMTMLKIGTAHQLPVLALFVLSPLIVEFASIIRMDMFQAIFNLLGLIFCILALSKERFLWAITAAGATVGLAVTSKYPGVVGAVPVIVAAGLMLWRRELSWTTAFLGLATSGAASLAAAFVTGPYLFLNFQGVLRDLTEEARTFNVSHTSPGFVKGAFVYLWEFLPGAISHVGTLLGLTGLTVLMPRQMRRDGGILLPVFFFSYLVFIALLNLIWTRWAIPLVPVACIGIAISLGRIDGWLSAFSWRRWAMVAILTAMIAPVALTTLPAASARAANNDTRARAEEWMHANLPAQSRLLIETYDPAVSVKDFDLYMIGDKPELVRLADVSLRSRPDGFFGAISDWPGSPETLTDAIARNRIDYVLLSNWRHRYGAERPDYGRENELYDQIQARYESVTEITPSKGELGPPILVLKAQP